MSLVCLSFSGPRGRSWNLTPVDLDAPESEIEAMIDGSIRAHGNIMSAEVCWWFDCEALTGYIWVGEGRTVGTISGESLSGAAT